jgi:hypothetical protein
MRILGFIFFIFLLACQSNLQNKPTKQSSNTNPSNKLINYDSCKNLVLTTKKQNANKWSQLSPQKKQQIFTKPLINYILPAWVGTASDFNGTTQTPQKGTIACGYFVTTALQDGGVKLNRVKLAKYASEQMITTLVQAKNINRFSNWQMPNFIAAVNEWGYGLYIIGLDNHTGFIYNDGSKIHFIHSTFVGTKNVQWELAENSWVLSSSKYKVLGKISEDEKILDGWIKN